MSREPSSEEAAIRDRAKVFARKNGKAISADRTDVGIYPSDPHPVSVFMAGSPGAGKTEASKALLENVEKKGTKTVRIDPDELRDLFEEYSGDNAWLFQAATSILVDKIHDRILKNEQSFLLDGTLSNYDIARKNIERSLKRGRFVQILYVYQDPSMAWDFVKIREKLDGRRILPEHFIEQYFAARKVVNQLKEDFGKDIVVTPAFEEFGRFR
jgi:predicted ABC-type ATPase